MSELNKYHTIKTLKKTSVCYEIPSEHRRKNPFNWREFFFKE